MLIRPQDALIGEALLLQTAVRLVGDGHLNQTGGKGRFEITLAEGFAVQ